MPDHKTGGTLDPKQQRLLDEAERKIAEGLRRVEETKKQLERSRRLLGEDAPKDHRDLKNPAGG
jgi:hypothetical protein